MSNSIYQKCCEEREKAGANLAQGINLYLQIYSLKKVFCLIS